MPTPRLRLVFCILALTSLGAGLLIFFLPQLHLLRNHVGDVMAIIFVYSCLGLVFKRAAPIAVITLALAIGVEFVQTLPLVEQESRLMQLILGQTFDAIDLVIYVVTTLTMASVHEHARRSSNTVHSIEIT